MASDPGHDQGYRVQFTGCYACLEVQQGPQEPESEEAATGGSDTSVEHAEYAESLLGAADAHERGVPFLLEDV